MKELPGIIQGEEYVDARGKLTFFNHFDMKAVKRFYMIEHPDTSIVRAWQAHKIEQKWFSVIAGVFKIVIAKPEDWKVDNKKQYIKEYNLQAIDNKVLHVPGGFANGFQALEPYSKLMVFSDMEIEKAESDDFRFDKNLWYQW